MSTHGGRRWRAARWSRADPINPQRVFWELSPRLPENCIVTADSGSVANWYGRDLKFRRGMKGSLSGSLASLGAATPYAMAAKMAYPDRVVIGTIGDGAMQMNGMNVMITVSKYWKEWSNPHFILMVLNNRDLNQVTWEERVQLGDGKTESTQSIPDFPYAQIRGAARAEGHLLQRSREVGAAWDEALAADRPVILEFYTDPERAALAAAHHAEGRRALHDHDAERAGAGQRPEELGQGADRHHVARPVGDAWRAERAGRTHHCARLYDPDGRAGGGRHLCLAGNDACRGDGRGGRPERAWATPIAPVRSSALVTGTLAEALHGHDAFDIPRVPPSDAERGAQSGPLRPGRDSDLGGRCGAVGSEGKTARPAARRVCWAARATRCRSTAAAVSPPTTMLS